MSLLQKRHAELLYHCALSDLKQDSDRAHLGFLWWILDPVIYLAMFYLIFEVILQRGGPGYVHFLLCGLVFWRWFDSTVRLAALSIRKYKGIISQVYLPKALLPMIAITSNMLKFSMIVALFTCFLVFSGFPPTASWLAAPLMLVTQLVLIIGVSLLVASVIPLVPDLMQLVNYGITLMFFLSGIFFDLSVVNEPLQSVLYLNPMALTLSCWRDLLLYQGFPAWQDILYINGFGLVLGAIGMLLLRRFDLRYPRLVN
ncbi:MAG: ABC transporter permease [Halieaceae bacterium]